MRSVAQVEADPSPSIADALLATTASTSRIPPTFTLSENERNSVVAKANGSLHARGSSSNRWPSNEQGDPFQPIADFRAGWNLFGKERKESPKVGLDPGALGQSHYATFGSLPGVDQADPIVRNMIGIDDGVALHSLKTPKAMDWVEELILSTVDRMKTRKGWRLPDQLRSSLPRRWQPISRITR